MTASWSTGALGASANKGEGTLETLTILAVILGPLLGAGAGTFFGLRGALNGLKERGERMEGTLDATRDYSRDSCLMMRDHQDESRASATKIDRLYEESKK